MWLEQKNYTFKTEKGAVNQDPSLDNIYLRVNENLTTVELKQLFVKINDSEFDEDDKLLTVKGYSILQRVEPISGELKINQPEADESASGRVKISFNSEAFGNLEIIEIENPAVQFNDKEISEDVVNKFEEKIKELAQVKTEEEVVVTGSPQPETATINKQYEIVKQRYLLNGYQEFVLGEYRLLVKKNDGKILASFYDIVSETEIVPYNRISETEENIYHVFNDKDIKLFVVSIDENTMKVEKIES